MKRSPQTLLKIFYGTGIAVLAYFSADATAAMVRTSVYDVPPVVWKPKPLRGDKERPAISSFAHRQRMSQVERALEERNPFCPGCAPQSEAEATAATPTKPGLLAAGERPTELPLQLLATMESSSPEHSLATVRWTEDGRVGVLAPGDACAPQARIHAIGQGMVHLDVGGQLEYLELVEHETKKKRRRKKKKKKKRKRRRRKRKWEIDGAREAIDCKNHRCRVDRSFVDKLMANPAKLSRQAKVRPTKGDRPGFKLYRVRRGSVPHLLGLRSGDVLTSVNGRELDSLDDAMRTYKRMRNASRLELTVNRRGKSVTKVVDIG